MSLRYIVRLSANLTSESAETDKVGLHCIEEEVKIRRKKCPRVK